MTTSIWHTHLNHGSHELTSLITPATTSCYTILFFHIRFYNSLRCYRRKHAHSSQLSFKSGNASLNIWCAHFYPVLNSVSTFLRPIKPWLSQFLNHVRSDSLLKRVDFSNEAGEAPTASCRILKIRNFGHFIDTMLRTPNNDCIYSALLSNCSLNYEGQRFQTFPIQ